MQEKVKIKRKLKKQTKAPDKSSLAQPQHNDPIHEGSTSVHSSILPGTIHTDDGNNNRASNLDDGVCDQCVCESPKTETFRTDLQSEKSLEKKIHIMCDLMCATFQHLQEKMVTLDTKIDDVKKSILETNTKLSTTIKTMHHSDVGGFKRVENKEAYLNDNICNTPSQDIVTYIRQTCVNHISTQNVLDLLYKSYDMYSFCADVIHEIQTQNNVHLFYAFAFQKNSNTIYYWNFGSNTWGKADQTILQHVFDAIQQGVACMYNELILSHAEDEDYDAKTSDYMEHSVNIFLDNFDKKHKVFKKLLFEKLST